MKKIIVSKYCFFLCTIILFLVSCAAPKPMVAPAESSGPAPAARESLGQPKEKASARGGLSAMNSNYRLQALHIV